MPTICTKIIKGEIPCHKVWEDDKHFAFLDINPWTEGHTLVVPKKEHDYLFDMPDADYAAMLLAAKKVAALLKRCELEEGPGDYWVDEKGHQILMTEEGHEHAEEILAQAGLLPDGGSLYDASNILMIHHLYAALRAHNLFLRDQQYVVQKGEVIIVDEFTGRLMSGRRWSDGLHQAVEAKEGVRIQNENQTLASITFQNYFRMYSKLSG